MSLEDRKATILLRKPCLDITLWAGYDPKDSQKNLDHYKILNKYFVASPGHGHAAMDDTYNKYQACFCLQQSQSVLVHDVLSCSFHTDILLLLSKQ